MSFPSALCSVLSNTERIPLVLLRGVLPPSTELVLVLDTDLHWWMPPVGGAVFGACCSCPCKHCSLWRSSTLKLNWWGLCAFVRTPSGTAQQKGHTNGLLPLLLLFQFCCFQRLGSIVRPVGIFGLFDGKDISHLFKVLFSLICVFYRIHRLFNGHLAFYNLVLIKRHLSFGE